jgi:hypothetical protein
LKFALDNAPSNFSAIKGAPAGGGQYDLTTQFCPNRFILEDNPATDNSPERWVLKFDLNHPGTPDDAAIWIIKLFSPVLKLRGYPAKPTLHSSEDDDISFEWDGPSHVWVSVGVMSNSITNLGATTSGITVGHDVK